MICAHLYCYRYRSLYDILLNTTKLELRRQVNGIVYSMRCPTTLRTKHLLICTSVCHFKLCFCFPFAYTLDTDVFRCRLSMGCNNNTNRCSYLVIVSTSPDQSCYYMTNLTLLSLMAKICSKSPRRCSKFDDYAKLTNKIARAGPKVHELPRCCKTSGCL